VERETFSEKPKRSRLELGEDGELVEVEQEENAVRGTLR
jgi:hypothetical protein